MRIFVGHSDDPDASGAAREAIQQVERALDGQVPRGALLYCCVDLDHQTLLDRIQEAWPGLPLVGCTTDGECSSCLDFVEDSVVLTVFAGEELELRVAVGRGVRRDVDGAAREIAAQLDGFSPLLVVALPESIGVSGAQVVEALNAHLSDGSVLVGGTAGDQWQFTETHQFAGREVLTDSIPVLAIGGSFEISVGVASGWEPLGRTGMVTRADGPLVQEIDGEAAIEFLRTNVGVQAQPTPEYPFAVLQSGDDFYLRAPMAADVREGWVRFAGDVPEGSRVQVTEASRDQILDGAERAAQQAFASFPGRRPEAMLIFSCAARKQVLGTRCSEEIGKLLSGGHELQAAGFYTYGEIAPLRPQGPALFHNETVVAALLGT